FCERARYYAESYPDCRGLLSVLPARGECPDAPLRAGAVFPKRLELRPRDRRAGDDPVRGFPAAQGGAGGEHLVEQTTAGAAGSPKPGRAAAGGASASREIPERPARLRHPRPPL